ncbi:hypothetical protein JCM19037_4509 [Geomicrobium sp. JCM 19037]|uniref:hypothetical protein n=1 Tax=unclassified Geomicrobium TaxID=2628951 RepID=UPI00045F1BB9|nr:MULTISPECIES: hypothetical protein [unclassified Geomicrobium]GAK05965.1 hypothetical protein JCM19037_4509 [Geomicrobium sp. JCM 19037]GAK13170.1 hypothetical protein JCM19039_2994 [Geomicrobium sp. JCM 19039]
MVNGWLILLLLIGSALTIGVTLAIAKNPGEDRYSSESSFNLLTLMYTVVVPIVLVLVIAILFFL